MGSYSTARTANEVRAMIFKLTLKITVSQAHRSLIEIQREAAYRAFTWVTDNSLTVRSRRLKRAMIRLSCVLHPVINYYLHKSIELIQKQLEMRRTRRKFENVLECLECKGE